jgi:3-isopropylmalate/(R)-2-methylmalate dehydratase large subunit
MGKTLYEKVFDRHTVAELSPGRYQLLMGLHLIHEVTSPQAFGMLEHRGLSVLMPERTFATVDHIIPTKSQLRPFSDSLAEEMMTVLEKNVKKYGIRFFSTDKGEQGIVHVVGPERGLTQPGMTICCGDSHTSTHGAFGAIAFGIGTIEVTGKLRPGVYAKDVTLAVIGKLGVNGGVGYAYEYGGAVIDAMTMDERMTVCNMSIEGGARCGYVNPDETTYAYLKGREFSPQGEAWDRAVAYWESVKSDAGAKYDDVVTLRGEDIEPVVTWGITPSQSIGVNETIPEASSFDESERGVVNEAYEYMSLAPGQKIRGTKVNVAFIGSCTNGRLSDFEEVVRLLQGKNLKVKDGVRALVVPGSQAVRRAMIEKGYDKVFEGAGFEFREAGCSMCLAMNPDKLQGREVCASSSNRNFKGRQGSPTGRTLLMSPAMVAAAAIAGEVTDARELFAIS